MPSRASSLFIVISFVPNGIAEKCTLPRFFSGQSLLQARSSDIVVNKSDDLHRRSLLSLDAQSRARSTDLGVSDIIITNGAQDSNVEETACSLIMQGAPGQSRGCWTMDDLVCADGTRCLKGGFLGGECDGGAITVPEGIQVQFIVLTGGWDNACGQDRTRAGIKNGPLQEFYVNMDPYVCAFQFDVSPGYECEDSHGAPQKPTAKPTPKPASATTPAPTEYIPKSTFCDYDALAPVQQDATATCGSRIDWLVGFSNKSRDAAEQQVCEEEPLICKDCCNRCSITSDCPSRRTCQSGVCTTCVEYTDGNCDKSPCFEFRGNTTCTSDSRCKCANFPEECAVPSGPFPFSGALVCRNINGDDSSSTNSIASIRDYIVPTGMISNVNSMT